MNIDPVLDFLRCRSPMHWVEGVVADLPTLLLDHASLELRAAEQAQKLIRRYGALPSVGETLIVVMSRLAREELRHFEQVAALIAARGMTYRPMAASGYAKTLHAEIRNEEPARLIDTLIVGAVIEARSCERFASLLPALDTADRELARFYRSLLKSEARHFGDYLSLAEKAAAGSVAERAEDFLGLDAALILGAESASRFLSC